MPTFQRLTPRPRPTLHVLDPIADSPQPVEREKFLTVKEVAVWLRCTPSHVYHLTQGSRPALPYVQEGRKKIIAERAVRAYLERNRVG